jgi:hypothetical protein
MITVGSPQTKTDQGTAVIRVVMPDAVPCVLRTERAT